MVENPREKRNVAPIRVVSHLDAPIEPYDRQEEIEEALKAVEKNTMVTRHRLAATYQIAAHLETEAMPGAFVECGTWKGGATGVMALASLRHGTGARTFHLFDSFQDMCFPDENIDGEVAISQARATPGLSGPMDGALRAMEGFYDFLGGHAHAQDVRDLLVGQLRYTPNRIHIHEGWFQDTLPKVRQKVGPIVLLRLDTDYYAGTRFCLEQLFDQLVPGGFVIIDDYGCYEGCRRAVDEFLLSLPTKPFLHHIDREGRYFIK